MDTDDPQTRIILAPGPDGDVQIYAIPCGFRIATKTDLDFHRMTCPACRSHQ